MMTAVMLAATVSAELKELRLDDVRVQGSPARVEAVVHGRNSSKDVLDEFVQAEEGEAAFRIKVDGKELSDTKVVPFAQTDRQMAFMLVLDVSGSMGGETCTRMIKVAKTFAKAVQPSPVGVVTAGDEVKALKPLNPEKPEFAAFFADQACRDSKTHLFQAASQAVNMVASPTLPSPRHVILLSDGADDSSGKAFSRDDVVNESRKQGVAIHTVAFKTPYWKQDVMAKLAQDGGGTAHKATTPDELNTAFQKIRLGLSKSPVVSALLPVDNQDGASHELTVALVGRPEMNVSQPFTTPQAPKPKVGPEPEPEPERSTILLPVAVLVVVVMVLLLVRRRRRRAALAKAAAALELEAHEAELAAQQEAAAAAAAEAAAAAAAEAEAQVEPEPEPAPVAAPAPSSPTVISRHLNEAWLEAAEGPLAPGQRVDLPPGEMVVVGSDGACSLQLDVVGLSGRHAELRF